MLPLRFRYFGGSSTLSGSAKHFWQEHFEPGLCPPLLTAPQSAPLSHSAALGPCLVVACLWPVLEYSCPTLSCPVRIRDHRDQEAFLDMPGSTGGPSLLNLCTHPTQHHPHGVMVISLSAHKAANILTQGVFSSPQHPAQGLTCRKPLITILMKEHLNKRNVSPKQIMELWKLGVEGRPVLSNLFISQMNTGT